MKDAENFMNKNYRVALQYDPDGYWIAEHPELPGCIADGETAQEALSSLDISRELWIESCLATGHEVPEPQEAPQYSGRFVLRIPKSLHRDLANEAEAEGVSLNSFVSNVLAGRHTRKEQSVSFVSQPAYQ
jgi:predicted RNase H-like HicB family nuclease